MKKILTTLSIVLALTREWLISLFYYVNITPLLTCRDIMLNYKRTSGIALNYGK